MKMIRKFVLLWDSTIKPWYADAQKIQDYLARLGDKGLKGEEWGQILILRILLGTLQLWLVH
jgi:hypothetical protein